VSVAPVTKSGSPSRANSTVTDAEGAYSLSNVQVGKARMSIALPDGSYGAIEIELDVSGDRPTASMTAKLVPRGVAQPTSMSIVPKSPSLAPGSTMQFSATLSPDSGVKPFYTVVGNAGTITTDGIFVAVKAGTVTVVAQVGNLTDSTVVTVQQGGVATTGAITGLVTDSATGFPVPDVAITVAGQGGVPGATGGPDGRYSISSLAPGDYTLQISKNGYTASSRTVTVVAGNATVADISLNPLVSISVDPNQIGLLPCDTQQFTATVTGLATTGVAWSVQEGSVGGAVTSSGLYTAPSVAGTYHVIATSTADRSLVASATVNVEVDVTIDPQQPTLNPGASQTFTADVTGCNKGVTWTVQEAGGGTVTNAGVYTAPNTPGTYHVVATSQAHTTRKATATVNVVLNINISVDPASVALDPGGTQQFAATVTGTSNTAVTWRVQEAGGGSVTSSGFYTAPAARGTYHVVATSKASASHSGAAEVKVESGSIHTIIQ
jgi:hypothetical protein